MGPCKKKTPDHGFVPAQVCTLVPTVTGVVPMRDVLQIRPMCRRYRLLVEPENTALVVEKRCVHAHEFVEKESVDVLNDNTWPYFFFAGTP